MTECNELKRDLKKVVKENKENIENIKKLKAENETMNIKFSNFQFDKDKTEAEVKSKERESKLKENTVLFNRSTEKQLQDGIIKDVDIEKYKL